MKIKTSSLFLIVLVVLSSRANAAVDFFKCNNSILNAEGTTNSSGDFAAQRMVSKFNPDGAPYSKDISVTNSEFSISMEMKTSDDTFHVHYKYWYALATRPTVNGGEARQYGCALNQYEACHKTADGSNSCIRSSEECFNPNLDPFDARYGWAQTSSFRGQAAFNEQLLSKTELTLQAGPDATKKAIIVIDCKFVGSYF